MITTSAEKLILQKLDYLTKEIRELREEKAVESIEEISIHKAAKLLHIGEAKLISMVECRKIKAISYRDHQRKKHYRFRISDIQEYQQKSSTSMNDEIAAGLSGEEIARRIFQKDNRMAKIA
jgi:hypothetical protein